jgi:hypothetical protein
LGANAHKQWRRVLEKAVEAGELALLHFGSKLPIQANTEPQAAPVVTAPVSKSRQLNVMKKAALIKELKHEWTSIEADISEATRNGLNTAAHTGSHGMWDATKARAWAESMGKLKKAVPAHSLDNAWYGDSKHHKLS